MENKLHYLFLMSLLGTACMANSESNTAINPKDILNKGKVLHTKEQPPSEKKSDLPMTTFRQDIKNHPVLWVLSSILAMFSSFLITGTSMGWFFDLLVEDKAPSPYPMRALVVPFVFLFIAFILYALASLIAAMWTSRWGSETKKGAPPPHYLLLALVFGVLYVSLFLLTY